MDVNTRVDSVGVDDQWPSGSETVCVLVENDVTFILNELFWEYQRKGQRDEQRESKYLALLVYTVNLSPSRVASLQLDAGTSETSPQSITGFPGMVVRDLAVDMVSDVSLGDTVCAGGSNPGHYGSEVTKEVAVISRQGTTGECKLAHTIMR